MNAKYLILPYRYISALRMPASVAASASVHQGQQRRLTAMEMCRHQREERGTACARYQRSTNTPLSDEDRVRVPLQLKTLDNLDTLLKLAPSW
jgi:hypothetical protein